MTYHVPRRHVACDAAISPAPVTGVTPRPDPFASLAPPAYSGCNFNNYVMIAGAEALNPGVYCGGITILGGKAIFNRK
ncbi:MAG: hypothetical protein ABSF64_09560 [Bryobacteraceae bacterium]|jgi:hypothetical protein